MARAAPLPHATVPIGRHGVEVHLIKVFCVGQLAVRSELPEREDEPEVLSRRVRKLVTCLNLRPGRRIMGRRAQSAVLVGV